MESFGHVAMEPYVRTQDRPLWCTPGGGKKIAIQATEDKDLKRVVGRETHPVPYIKGGPVSTAHSPSQYASLFSPLASLFRPLSIALSLLGSLARSCFH